MPTPASWHAEAERILAREQRRTPAPPLAWPMTPEEREAIPDYGDLVSNIIWYPIYSAVPVVGVRVISCRNCGGQFAEHDRHDGLCPNL